MRNNLNDKFKNKPRIVTLFSWTVLHKISVREPHTHTRSFLDAIASVGLYMSVCWSVFLFDDGTYVTKGIAAYGAIIRL